MSKTVIAIAAAIVLASTAQPAFATPSNEAEPTFRFAFNHSELASPAAQRGLEARLNREAVNYCRSTSEGLSPVLANGCRRSVIRAARTALAQARAGRG